MGLNNGCKRELVASTIHIYENQISTDDYRNGNKTGEETGFLILTVPGFEAPHSALNQSYKHDSNAAHQRNQIRK